MAGCAITQLSVAIALISGLSIAGLGAGLALLQNSGFSPSGVAKPAFAASQLLFVVAAFCCCAAVISRLLDFRLTARKVRDKAALRIFGSDLDPFGCATWRLFWVACISFLMGATLLVVSVGSAYVHRLM